LPSAKEKTLGKKKTLGKEGTLPSGFFTLGKVPSLPSVFFTLGKDPLCRVQKKKHSAKKISNQNLVFAECFFLTLGKVPSLPSVFFDTRQRPSLPSAKKETLGKENFKSKFEALNKFKSKNFELQSCITSQDL